MAGWEPVRGIGSSAGPSGRYGTGGAPRAGKAGGDQWLASLVDVLTERRRWVIALLVAGAVGATLYVLAPPGPPSRAVLAAARDLAAGAALASDDVTAVQVPAGVVPTGALTPDHWTEGLLLSGPVRRGEVLTDIRTLGPDLLDALAAGPSGSDQHGLELVATPVRLADPGISGLLRTGQLVDVLAAAPPQLDPISGDALPVGGSSTGFGFGSAQVVAAAVRVIAVPAPNDGDLLGGAPGADGPLIVLATSPATAATLAAAATSARLSVVIRARAPPGSGPP